MRKLTSILMLMAMLWCSSLCAQAGEGGKLTCSNCRYTVDVSLGRGFVYISTLLFCSHCVSFPSVITNVDDYYLKGKSNAEIKECRSKIVNPLGEINVTSLDAITKSYIPSSQKTVTTYSCPKCRKTAYSISDNVISASNQKPIPCPKCKSNTLKYTQTILFD